MPETTSRNGYLKISQYEATRMPTKYKNMAPAALLYYYCLKSNYMKNVAQRQRRIDKFRRCKSNHSRNVQEIQNKMRMKKLRLITLVLLALYVPRERSLWMHPRTDAWFNLAKELFTDAQWYENFRVTKKTFNLIVSAVARDIKRKTTILREPISVEKRVAITMYFLSSTAEYRTIANLFGVSKAFVCLCIKDVCAAILKRLQSKYITIPKRNELENIISKYKRKWGFPACFGAIDGTHIPISAPYLAHSDYINRKGYHSIVMQAVVDCNYLFRDIVVGWPGSVHDARVLSNSKIFQSAEENTLLPKDFTVDVGGKRVAPVLLGDPAYPLLNWLMKPFPENPNTPRQYRKFNYRLSRARVTVENVFGRWKGRFRRFLKRTDMDVNNVITVIAASCILHNICELNREELLSQWEEESCQDILNYPQPDPLNNTIDEEDSVSVRDHFMNYFMSAEGFNIGSG